MLIMKPVSPLVDFRHVLFFILPNLTAEVRKRCCRFVEDAEDRLRRFECWDPQVSQRELSTSTIRLYLTASESD